MAIQNRYDFVLLFDVKDGNPNGDPDAGNLPRLDSETGKGLVTDVCVKRKVRNYVAIKHQYQRPHDIYVKEKAVLGRAHTMAFQELSIKLGQDMTIPVPDNIAEEIAEVELPEGMSFDTNDEDNPILLVSGMLDKKEVQKAIKESDLSKKMQAFLNKSLTDAKPRKPTTEETERGREKMCQTFYDIRTFGAVMSLKSAPNCGQVRGPVQLTFARSVDPIVSLEHSITRMAVATEAEAEKQGGDNRTMGRKHTVPYGLYVAHGFISAHLANQTGFSEDDLNLLWDALANMFEHDRSAARGEMTTRGLYVFKHDSQLGNAHAHSLFDHVTAKLKDNVTVPREFMDYNVLVDGNEMVVNAQLSPAQGVTLTRMV
jgi:CRISPR-associated protein Csd2